MRGRCPRWRRPAAPDRVGYLAGHQGAGRAEAMRRFAERDQALEASRDGEYVLWFEADLSDQLQIAEILARLAEHLVRAPGVRVSYDQPAQNLAIQAAQRRSGEHSLRG